MATKHGMRRTKIYGVWNTMRSRCYKPSQSSYKYYGGKGIRVCDRWIDSFPNFYADMGDAYADGLTLDRIDSDGDYTPENCRWASPKTQANNTSKNRMITINGVSKTLAQWIDASNLKSSTVRQRYYVYGWDIVSSLNLPAARRVVS